MNETKSDSGADMQKMYLLNDIAWHSFQIRRLTVELAKIGISEDEISSYMDDYVVFVQGASEGAFKVNSGK